VSGIAALCAPGAPVDRDRALGRLLAAMPDRGSRCVTAPPLPYASLGAAVHPWQEAIAGPALGRSGGVSVVADATLYYRGRLVERLRGRGIRPATLGSGDLIAAAVAAWGADAPAMIEGDFAFVAIRAPSGEVVAARDPIGTRPLGYAATAGGGLMLASSPAAFIASGLVPRGLNVAWLAELCSGVVTQGNETAFAAVCQLRQGERLTWSPGRGVPVIDAWWECPSFTERGTSHATFAEAAAELRALLFDAVRERLDERAVTAVTLSGGRDSPSVYAAGRAIAGDGVRPISLSYPPGDRGREDETILEVLQQCGGIATWVDTARIPLLRDPLQRATQRPDAFAHPFEQQSIALGAGACQMGARVVLNGLGGDTLFHAELSFLADLVARGRWRLAAREWRALGRRWRARDLFRYGLLPILGPGPRAFAAALRGGAPVRDAFDRPFAPWIRPDFVAAHDLEARKWSEFETVLRSRSAADRERRLLLLGAFPGRIIPEYCRLSLECGIEQRSPLYDLRIVQFAAGRPRSERRLGIETKRLLRAAMTDFLPLSVTGPRQSASGFTGDYLRRTARSELPRLHHQLPKPLVVAELGMVSAPAYAEAVATLARRPDAPHLAGAVFTALVECWLRVWTGRNVV
jgi:asparagine synthase (glutamine-hydrolysing)